MAGTERLVLTHADELSKKGYNVDIACMYLNPNVFPKRFGKYKIIEYDKNARKIKRAQRIIYPYRMAHQNIDFLKTYDLIICYRPGTNIMAMKAKEKFGVPIIWYCSHPMKHLYPKYFRMKGTKDIIVHYALLLLKRADKKSLKYFDRIYVNSHHMWTKVNMIYNIDNHLVLYPPPGKIFKENGKGKFIFSLSRISFEKNQMLLLKSLSLLKHPPQAIIAGRIIDRNYFNKLKLFIKQNKLNVKFVNEISDKKIQELYNRALMCVYTPTDEDFGIIPLESLSAGKVCFTHVSNGISEILPLSYVFADEEELADKIRKFISTNMPRITLNEKNLAKRILNIHINQLIDDIKKIRKRYIK